MIESPRTRARAGIVGTALAFLSLAAPGCEQEHPVIDTSTKGGIPGSQPAQEKVQIQTKSRPGSAPSKPTQ
jgi:hypothetical protein